MNSNFDKDCNIARSLSPSWNLVRIGIGLMSGATRVLLATSALLVIGVLFWDWDETIKSRGALHWLKVSIVVAVFVAILVGGMTFVFGQCLCCAAPAQSRARKHIGVALVFFGLSFTFGAAAVYLYFLFYRLPGLRRNVFVADGLILVTAIGSLIFAYLWHVYSVLFLKAVATFFNQDAVVQNIKGYLRFFFIFGIIGGGLGALVFCIYFLRFLGEIRSTITLAINAAANNPG